jgi:hypothetical protein
VRSLVLQAHLKIFSNSFSAQSQLLREVVKIRGDPLSDFPRNSIVTPIDAGTKYPNAYKFFAPCAFNH